MVLDSRDIVVSAVVAFLAGLALWPPRAVYWERAAATLGEGVTLALVVVAAVAVGAGLGRATGVGTAEFLAGGAVAYLAGMVAVAVVLAPDSPAHLASYGLVLGCLVAGVALADRYSARSM